MIFIILILLDSSSKVNITFLSFLKVWLWPQWTWTGDFPWTCLRAFWNSWLLVFDVCHACSLLSFLQGVSDIQLQKRHDDMTGLVALLWMVKCLLGCSMRGSRNIFFVFVYALPAFGKGRICLVYNCGCFPSPSTEALSSLEATMKSLISKHSPTQWVRSCLLDVVMLKRRDTMTLTCYTPVSKLPSLVSSQAFPALQPKHNWKVFGPLKFLALLSLLSWFCCTFRKPLRAPQMKVFIAILEGVCPEARRNIMMLMMCSVVFLQLFLVVQHVSASSAFSASMNSGRPLAVVIPCSWGLWVVAITSWSLFMMKRTAVCLEWTCSPASSTQQHTRAILYSKLSKRPASTFWTFWTYRWEVNWKHNRGLKR